MSNILNINFWLKMNWVWIGVKKKLGAKDEKITKYIGKGQIQVISE